MILYVVVSAAGKVLRDFRPPIPILFVKLEDALVFFLSPTVFLDIRI